MIALLTVATVLSAPYVDSKGRFSLDLPAGWEMGPLPAGEAGASFRRASGGSVALVAVRVVGAVGKKSPAAVARSLAEGIEKEPGYRLASEGSTELAGYPAARRRYVVFVDGKQDLLKMAEDRVTVRKGTAFVVHVETLQPSFASFQADFARFFATFSLSKTPRPASGTDLSGRWLMVGTETHLALDADGRFDLAGTTGTYEVAGDLLVLRLKNGEESFTWRMDGVDLILSSDNLDEPIRYRRDDNPLVGEWKGKGHALVLGRGGKATLGDATGTYRIDKKKIVFRLDGKKSVVRFVLKGDLLRLSGGPFGGGVALKRQ